MGVAFTSNEYRLPGDESVGRERTSRGVDPIDDGLESGGVRRSPIGESDVDDALFSISCDWSSGVTCSGAKTLMPFSARIMGTSTCRIAGATSPPGGRSVTRE